MDRWKVLIINLDNNVEANTFVFSYGYGVMRINVILSH